MALSSGQRLLLLALNSLPLVHVIGVTLVIWLPSASVTWRLAAGVGFLYLAPPLVARLVLRYRPPSEGTIPMGSRDFFTWWALLSLQVLFCRLPALEETLRLVPGLYSAWLRLWGARIGRLTYWSSGTRILDRPFLAIGDDVVFGAGVRINAHVLARGERGGLELLLSTIDVGHRAVIGGYSLLTAGTRIAPDETTRACLVSPPFSFWKGGKRTRRAERPDR